MIEVYLDMSYDAEGETGAGSSSSSPCARPKRLRPGQVTRSSSISPTPRPKILMISTWPACPLPAALFSRRAKVTATLPGWPEEKIPFIVVGSTNFSQYSYVDLDNLRQRQTCCEPPRGIDAEKIACLGKPQLKFQPSLDRIAGFRQVLRGNGLTENAKWMLTDDWDWENGYKMMDKILQDADDRPTAVFACNDMLALGASRHPRSWPEYP